jgi:uncharacterized phage-associated protein
LEGFLLRFDSEKVTEAAALLLNLRGGRMHYIKLLKLLYLADREALQEWGIPISHDNYVSMDHGPVLSQTYNLIRDGASEFWSEHISPPFGDWEIELKGPPPARRKLSRAEDALLRRIYEAHGHSNRWRLIDYVHTFPEWHDPKGSSIPIPIDEILEALGEPEASVSAIVSELKRERKIEERLEAIA